MPLTNRFAEMHTDITAWRRDIHQHPELQYDTQRTSALVADKLREFGCDTIKEGIGKTGVIGVIKGKQDNSGKVIGLRADMDALPILEATDLPYASRTAGKMHACGHDGHTAMLLGASQYLAETRNFDGTAVVIFQPAEEGGAGGLAMVEDGLIEDFNIQEIYGMHNWPNIPLGQFAIRPGPFFAATAEINIQVTGRGGHAAMPNTTIDTTLIASHIVVALQSVASRTIDPIQSVVVSITSFETESKTYNVIPAHVTLRGTLRTLATDVCDQATTQIQQIADNTAAAFGGEATVTFINGYPAMVNAEVQTAFAASVARDVSGAHNVNDTAPPVMGGEDFAYMLEACPGAYIMVGNGDSADLHNPKYNFNDEAIPAGCSYWARLIEMGMPAK